MSKPFTINGQARTENASKYLMQLCKHWSHKGETEFSSNAGFVAFSSGERVELSVDTDVLKIVVSANSQLERDEFLKVVETHIARFAFRENLEFEWAR